MSKTKMRAEQKSNVKNSVGRLVFAGLSLLLQVFWILLLLMKLNDYSTAISLCFSVAALLVVLHIYDKHENAAFKMPWIILILAFPVLGLCIYGLFGHKNTVAKVMRERFETIEPVLFAQVPQEETVMRALEEEDYAFANQCRYIHDYGKYPVYRNTDVTFYAEAAEGLEAQLADLKKAEHFIFMEYHAIEEAEAFGRLKEILAERAAHGVEVRLFYDDVGSIGFIDRGFIKRMEEIGVQCRVFNPVLPVLNIFMNNRDHRKITVIDGKVGYTGGYNLADEYFNITHPYGYWKDTGVRLVGDAVKSLTVTFLEMWNATAEADTDYAKYLPEIDYHAKESGFVQPYADSPLDSEYVGENVYLNLIKSAKHYFYAATPYLIISDEMARELGMAAQRGVDVRIVTPGIPDKKLVYQVTRSYYAPLVQNDVRIYEYTPGFLHAKQTLCDGNTATVGTINFDYRSLYHHFENGVFLHGCETITDIGKDFENLFAASREVTQQYRGKRSMAMRIKQCILRLFAPLL